MRRGWLLLLPWLCPLAASAAEPFATATIDETDKIVPGQQVHLTVDVFVPDFFTSPPQFPLFELPNALVTLPQERTQNLSKTIDGVPYAGIRRRYVVVPEIAGRYVIPTISIEFGYSADGNMIRGHAETASLTLAAEGDAGSAGLSARHLTVEQAFDRDPNSLKIGDALVRTITITAEDTQAMMMPPVEAGASAGLTRYEKTPDIKDGIATGRGRGSRRTEVFVYTASAEGRFEIPAIIYPWFDLDKKEETQASLPATEVAVSAAPAKAGIAPDPIPDTKTPFEHRQRLTLGVGALLVAAAALWFARGLPHAIATWMARTALRVRQSRRYRLRQLRKIVRSSSLPQVHAGLHQWARTEGFRTLHAWAQTGDPALSAEIDKLESILFSGDTGTFDRRGMARLVTTAGRGARARTGECALPELNPSAGR